MKRRSLIVNALGALTLTFVSTSPVAAQDDYPNRPITIIVPSAAGGGTDLAARRTAELMSKFLGQSIIIENHPGAGTTVGSRYAAGQPADGYTILAPSSALTLLPHAFKDIGFDPLTDFEPIGVMLSQPNVFSVGADSPFKTMAELIEYAKAHPGEVTFGSGGQASPTSYVVRMVALAAGVEFTEVQYKGAGDTFPDVIAGRVGFVSSGYVGQVGFYPGGELRPLAVSSAERLGSLPDVPTLQESGVDVVSSGWLGLLAPKGTPEPVIQKLSDALKFALEDENLRNQILAEGSDPSFVTPAEFAEVLVSDAKKFEELAKASGMIAQ